MSHPVVAGLRSASAAERRAACRAATGDPSAVLLVDALVAALGDADAAVADAAGRALERIGREHASVLTALRAPLRSGAPRERLAAAWTWAHVEPPPIALLPAVVSALDGARRDARWRAARLLVELGRLHDEVLPVVAGLAVQGTPRERRIALGALRELAPSEPATLRAHLDASRAGDTGLQRFALTSLAGLGARSPEVWARLAEALADPDDAALRRVAVTAVSALGDPDPPTRAALERAAEDADESVRAAARRALAHPSFRKAQ